MALTHSTAARNAAANAVVDLLDVGSTNASARLLFTTGGGTTLATLPMSATAFGNAASGVATANAITSDTNAAVSGTATVFHLTDKDNTLVISGTVGNGSGGDINLSSNVITAGDTVSMSSLTYTAAP
jgi:hypothetical protein